MRCLTPECKEEAKARGLCFTCYSAAKYMVRCKKTTWSKLEEKGLCKPAHTSLFRNHFDEKRKS